jgi:hypothetical protein
MSLFRSEEHAQRWVASKGYQPGRIVDLDTVWALAKAWYVDPRGGGWRPRTRAESQTVLASVGLTDDFWTLPG